MQILLPLCILPQASISNRRQQSDAWCSLLLDEQGDFATGIDEEWTLDAAPLVKDTSTFHAVHMNHSRLGYNWVILKL
jgi:hypothetical protein